MHRIRTGELFTSYQMGGLRLISLRDGYVDMPTTRLRQPGNREFQAQLPTDVQLVNGALRLSVNAFVIDDGSELTLIDTGASNTWHSSMGRLPQALEEANIAVQNIRTVAFTHTHIDHINGLVLPDGRDAFPHLSRLLVPEAEMRLFRSEQRLRKFHEFAEAFQSGQRITPHIETVPAVGHEIGHTFFRIENGGEVVLIWGDIVHVPSLQFRSPEIAWEFDADQDQARQSRLRLMTLASEEGHFVAGAHLDSPGVGRVRRIERGFRFDPI